MFQISRLLQFCGQTWGTFFILLLVFAGCKDSKDKNLLKKKSKFMLKRQNSKQEDTLISLLQGINKPTKKRDCRERTWRYSHGFKIFASSAEGLRYYAKLAKLKKEDAKTAKEKGQEPDPHLIKLIDFRMLQERPDEEVRVYGYDRPRIIKVGANRVFFLDEKQHIILEKYIPCRDILVAESGRAVLLIGIFQSSLKLTYNGITSHELYNDKGKRIAVFPSKTRFWLGSKMFISHDLQEIMIVINHSIHTVCLRHLALYDRRGKQISRLRVTKFAITENRQRLLVFKDRECSCIFDKRLNSCTVGKEGTISQYKWKQFELVWKKKITDTKLRMFGNNVVLATSNHYSAFAYESDTEPLTLVTTDSSGRILWTKTYKVGNPQSLWFWLNEKQLIFSRSDTKFELEFLKISQGKLLLRYQEGVPLRRYHSSQLGILCNQSSALSILNSHGGRIYIKVFDEDFKKAWVYQASFFIQTKTYLSRFQSERLLSLFKQYDGVK